MTEVDRVRQPIVPAITAAGSANDLEPTRRRARCDEYLGFHIGDEEYAMGILFVQEIRSYAPPTHLAGAPPGVKGVVDLRGVIVPIVDLRLVLGIQEPRYDAFTVVIVLKVLQRMVGVIVDSVSDVIELQPHQIRAAPGLHGTKAASFISGIATLSLPTGDGGASTERMVILTDVEQLLSDRSVGLLGHGDPLR
jgi:purine-binding chemotaxis protein CheW